MLPASVNVNEPSDRIEYVLDTDTTTAYQRNRPSTLARLANVNANRVATTVITMYEQLRGRMAVVHRAAGGESAQVAYQWLQETHRYFCYVVVLPFDSMAASTYRSLVAQRLGIGTQDLQIAAITVAHRATLVTSNRRDFERIPGLRIDDWNVT